MTMHKFAGRIVLYLNVLIWLTHDVLAGPSVSETLKRLREAEAKLSDVNCTYSRELSAGEAFARSYADAMKMTYQESVDHFKVKSDVKFAMRRDGSQFLKYYEEQAFNKEGVEQNHWLIAFDGAKRYYLHDIPKSGDRLVPQVTMGGNELSRFASSCDIAILMGLSLPECEGTLTESAQNGAEVSGPISIDGTDCTQLTISKPSVGESFPLRYKIFLNNRQHLSIHSITQEQIIPTSPEWSATLRWKVKRSRRDERSSLWLPIEVEREEIGQGSVTILASTTRVASISVNSGTSPDLFSPKIEDGSNVWDEKAKRGYVAGRKPSKRILGFIKQAAEEARQENLDINNGPTVQVPSVGSTLYGPILVGLGLFAVAFAAILHRRSRVLQD